MIPFVRDDGGRAAAGFKGTTGDCAVRAIAIATDEPYRTVYDGINVHALRERPRGGKSRSNARTRVWPQTVSRLLTPLGWEWTPTMGIGTGTTVHLRPDELPAGRVIVRLSRHYAAVIDGVLHDLSDCSRDGTRAVYGYWTRRSAS
jgi:hypothetical protein